jgi:hypothetical protein
MMLHEEWVLRIIELMGDTAAAIRHGNSEDTIRFRIGVLARHVDKWSQWAEAHNVEDKLRVEETLTW